MTRIGLGIAGDFASEFCNLQIDAGFDGAKMLVYCAVLLCCVYLFPCQ